jgi:hypothetical protein
MTPKEYIELVEKKKAQRIRYAAEEAGGEATEEPDSPSPSAPQ